MAVRLLLGVDPESGEVDLLMLAVGDLLVLGDTEGAGAGAWRPSLGSLLGDRVTVREALGKF